MDGHDGVVWRGAKGEEEVGNVGDCVSVKLEAGHGSTWGFVNAEAVRDLGNGKEVEVVAR